MNRLKYLLIGTMLMSSAAYAQEPSNPNIPDLPDFSKPDPAASGNTPAAPAPGAKKEILNKAVDDVFNEPAPAAQPAAVKPVDIAPAPTAAAPVPTEAPDVSEDTAPDLSATPDTAPVATDKAAPVAETVPSTEATINIEPVNSGKAPAPTAAKSAAAPPALPAAKEVPSADVKPLDETRSVEKAPAINMEKASVSKQAETTGATKAQKAKAKPKAKPKKKVNFPKETPKSLRQDYLTSDASQPSAMPAAAPMTAGPGVSGAAPQSLPGGTPMDVPAVYKSHGPAPKAEAPSANTMAPVNYPKGTYPVNYLHNKSDKADKMAEKPESLKSVKVSAIEENDLDAVKFLPEREKKITVKNDINIDNGKFNDPFASDSSGAIEESGSKALAAMNNDPNAPTTTADTPVVDFSDNNTVSDTAGQAAPVQTSKAKPIGFYMRDKSLEMEVKDAPKTQLGAMQNGFEALSVGQYESAVKYYNEVLEKEPKNTKALMGAATAYQMSKDYDKAKEAYLKVIKTDPDNWSAVNNYIILVAEGNPEKAIDKLEDLKNKNPTFAGIPAQLGSLYFKKGETQKAVDNYSEAIRIDPDNVNYRYNLALILEKSDEYAGASALYRSLLNDAAKGTVLPENPIAIRERYFDLISKSRNG